MNFLSYSNLTHKRKNFDAWFSEVSPAAHLLGVGRADKKCRRLQLQHAAILQVNDKDQQ